ncbi:carbohydrate ABC transporter permease [Brachybacterium paraconglomeratum]|uniref:carbohydrate ABC transporter permease n=1 Tax=Brachybacterium paraconglomeratum TaxID=173362 RepID=UPI0037C85B9B
MVTLDKPIAVGRRSRRSVPGRPPWMGRPSPTVQALKVAAIAMIVVVMLYPFLYVIAFSFADADSVTSGAPLPTSFSTAAYESIFAGGVVTRSLLVTAGITVVGTVLSLIFTSMLAYGLTRTRRVPFARATMVYVLCTMFFGAGIIPNYLLIKQLGLLDSYWSLILPGLISAFNMIVMRNFFMELPEELLESARIDGASEFRIFRTIVLPLSKAVIAVIGLFYAVGYWNSFFNALIYINDTAKWPIQLVLNQYVVQSNSLSALQAPDQPAPPTQAVQMAIVVVATLPILVVYPFAQRFFAKGVLTGAIKG